MSTEPRTVLLVVLLSLSAVGGAAGSAAAVPDARLAVSAVTVTPDAPTVGAQVVVGATLRNSAGSPSAVEVDRVELRGPDATLTTADDVGSLSPGDTVAVPLAATFDEPGARSLTVRVVGRDADGERVTVTRPVPVVIEGAPPQVDVETGPAAVDSPTRVAVTVGNPTTAPVRDVAIRLAEPLGRANRSTRVRFVPTLAAGAETTVNLTTVPDAAGSRELVVATNYTDASGAARAVTRTVTVSVVPHRPDLGVEVRRAPPPEEDAPAVPGGIGGLIGGEAGPAAAASTGGASESDGPQTVHVVEVTNFGTVRATDVVVTPTTGNHTLARQRLDAPLAPGDSGTVRVDLAGVRESGPVEFRVDYRAGVRAASTTTTLDYRPEAAGLELTDVDVSRTQNGSITVSGNLANVGRGTATGVVVEVVERGNVTPTYPTRRYFVGELEGSDFAPFDLTARTTGATQTVTVRVLAREAGVESARVVTLSLPAPPEGGGTPLSVLVAAGVAVPLLALAGFGWRRRRRGS